MHLFWPFSWRESEREPLPLGLQQSYPPISEIQDKLDQMVFFWEDIKARAEEREIKFLDVLELAEKFWYDMTALLTTIRDTQDIVHDLESPGIDPSIIKQQVEAAEVRRAKEAIPATGRRNRLPHAMRSYQERRGASYCMTFFYKYCINIYRKKPCSYNRDLVYSGDQLGFLPSL